MNDVIGAPSVIAEEGPVFVLSKPSGMAVHRTNDPSMADLMTWAKGALGVEDIAPVHRLDRETSGVVICATTSEARAGFQAWFAAGEVEKSYLALVFGAPHQKGTIKRALKDQRRGRPLAATTRYRRLEVLAGCALVEARPETGRKHQIRRHLHGVGHPVVGDRRYRPKRFRPIHAFPGRLWLHAASLTLPDGRTFNAPLPDELAAHLDALRGLENDDDHEQAPE